MKNMNQTSKPLFFFVVVVTVWMASHTEAQPYATVAPFVQNGIWIQPTEQPPSQPVWGFAEGIRVGLAPLPGPRGLLRIYTPYLGHEPGKMINFIAVEPIPQGSWERGFSELEMSTLDMARGKRMWSADTNDSFEPGDESQPAKGVIREENGIETLTVYVYVEPFNNGTNVYLKVKFYEDRPYEVELSSYLYGDSDHPGYCVLTATMGNFARLRNLHLDDEVMFSGDLWPEYRGDAFAEHQVIPSSDMIKDKNGIPYFIASPDEPDPSKAEYAPSTRNHWKYYGKKATQYWYCPDDSSGFDGLVNGRFTYWASQSPIPGGISYENFELKRPFSEGQTFVFGISPLKPKAFIHSIRGH